MYAHRCKVILVLCVFCFCQVTPCTLCHFIKHTTTLSNCSESCGGGTRYYFHYLCCGNLNKSECETSCNRNLTNTKSVKVFVDCNTFCSNGGTFQKDTVGTGMCLCPPGTTGRCCDMYVKNTMANSTKVTSFSSISNPTDSRPVRLKNATSHVITEKTTTHNVNTNRVRVTNNLKTVSTISLKPKSTQTPNPAKSRTSESTDRGKQGIEVKLVSTEATNISTLSTGMLWEGTQLILSTDKFLTGNPIQNGENVNSSSTSFTKSALNSGKSSPTETNSLNIKNDTTHETKTALMYTQPVNSSGANSTVGSLSTKAPNPQNSHTESEMSRTTNPSKQESIVTMQSTIIVSGNTSVSTGTQSTVSKAKHFQGKPSRNGKKTLYLAVGVPLGMILIAAVISLIFYVWLTKRKRNHRVDVTNDEVN